MPSLLQRLGGDTRSISTVDDYALAMAQYQLAFSMNGIQSTYGEDTTVERIGGGFPAMAQSAYRANGIVFSCMMVRQLVFSSARFRFQRMRDGAGSDLFSTAALAGLDRPAPGETTQDLLSRMIQDADLEGNAYHIPSTPLVRLGNGDPTDTVLLRLRPDWVDIVTKPLWYTTGEQRGKVGQYKFAYVYTEGGDATRSDPVVLNPADVSHFAPIPDPLANFRGMSWLTPVLREIQNDGLMNRHKERFFTKGGTPNVVIKHADGAKKEAVLEWAKRVQAGSNQPDSAYKTLNLYPGADATVIGSNMRELDFKAVQGAGETRIAAAAGVPPIIVGLSEGLEAATYSNYSQARRRFADGTMHPLWTNAAGSLEQIIDTPGTDTRLWYDVDDVPFLREDEKDAAEIAGMKASTISSLITAGYEPDSVVLAVDADDLRLLKHTGLFSVQLQAPGTQAPVAVPAERMRSSEDRTEAPPVHNHIHVGQPATNVTVEGAVVNVPDAPAPEVRVDVAAAEAPNVYVDVAPAPAAEVRVDNVVNVDPTPVEVRTNVEAPSVTVAAPNVTVEAAEAPAVTVNVDPTPVEVRTTVEAPNVSVEAPSVTVEAPEVRVDVAAAEAPNVTVENVVNPAPVTVVPDKTRATRATSKVIRNVSTGEIESTETTTEVID